MNLRLSNVSLGKKFTLMLSLFVFIISFVAYIGWNNMKDINHELNSVSTEQLPAINYLLQLDRDLHQAVIAERMMFLNPLDRDSYQKDYQENITQCEERWNKYKELASSDAEKELFGEFEKKLKQWKNESQLLLNDLAIYDTSVDKTTLTEKFVILSSTFDIAREDINKLTEILEKQVEAANVIHQEEFLTAENKLLWIVIIAFMLSISSWFLLTRLFITPVKKLSADTQLIAAGNFNIKINELKYTDEVGKLQKAVKQMTENILEKMFWYESILDSIPMPISVTDNNMNWTYINKPVEDMLKVKKDSLVGKHCSGWNANICKTKNCGVQRLKDGFKDTYFDQAGMNFKVDSSYIKNTKGEVVGHIEVVQDVTQIKSMENYLSDSTKQMINQMDKFAEGDLTVELQASKDDDIGKLFNGFNKAVANISALIKNVREAVHATASASSEISSSTEEMAAGAQEQSAQTSEVASAIEQMSKTIFETTRSASQAAENARKAGTTADEGGKVVEETVNGMKRIAGVVIEASETVKKLGENSDQIGEIIQVIDDIADQTNLLALNAAIEAARAGEMGRGFAVVADEVRKLAERTTKATKEIALMIKQIQKDTTEAVDSMKKGTSEVEKGRELANRAGQSLKEIIFASGKVVDDVNQVAGASEEQSSAAEQISKSIDSISNVTQESASGIQQVARSAEDLNRLTEHLQQLLDAFKLEGMEKTSSSYKVRKNGKIVHA